MTGIIRAPRAHTHDLFPRAAVRDGRLSYRARGILMRLLSNADGFSMDSNDLAAEAKEGREAVRTALNELRALGYMRTKRRQLPNGRWVTETFVYETAQPPESTEDGFSGVGFPGAGNPGVGKPGAGSPDAGSPGVRSSKSSSKRSSSKAHAAVPAAPVGKEPEPDKPAARAAEPPSAVHHAGRKRKRTHPETGVTYWYDDEVAEIEALVQAHTLAAVRDAASDLRARGKDPLPSIVGAAVLARQRADAARTVANSRHERTPEERAEDARKATEAMAEYRRLLEEGS